MDPTVFLDVVFHSFNRLVDVVVLRMLHFQLFELIFEVSTLPVEVFEVADSRINLSVVGDKLVHNGDKLLLVIFTLSTTGLVLADHFNLLGSPLSGAIIPVHTQNHLFHLRPLWRLDPGGVKATVHGVLVSSPWAFTRHVLLRFDGLSNTDDFPHLYEPFAANFFDFFLRLLSVIIVIGNPI